MPVLLFNYPAVGKSYRPRPDLPLFEYWNELDRHSAYETVIEETRQVIAESSRYFQRCHLAGYSFGATMALAALSPAALSYTAIAPPLAEHDFSSLASLSIPTCLIKAELEDLLAAPVSLPMGNETMWTTIKGANHFFLHKEQLVADHIFKFLLPHSLHKRGSHQNLTA
jgi:alpha/beta superfamily hydrolase